jgi:hypothetical protein
MDQTGVECVGAAANQICQALHDGQATSVACGGKTWRTGNCGNGMELTTTSNICSCDNGYTIRPCIGNGNPNWGGVNTATCNGPTQTIEVVCQ